MDIYTCQDVMNKAMDLYINFTENAFEFMIKSALGIAKNIHEDAGLKKSLNVS
jgi:hypothetical protein